MSDVNSLFQSAADEGELSPEALGVLQVADVGAQIQNALGVDPDEFEASEVILVTQMIDDSGSIRFVPGNAQSMREGHNLVLSSLGDTKQADAVLAMTRYLSGETLFPYSPLAQAVMMDQGNYNPVHGTPLYDQSVVLLGAVLAKAQEFADNGIVARTVTLISTDGADIHSVRNGPTDVAKLVQDMLRQENHILAAIGIDDGETDFRDVFSQMGVPDEWILTPGKTPSEIRAAFQTVSQSAVRASQGAASFSQTAVGGFGS